MIRNKGLRVIYVFSTDLDALFHVNYGKVPSFKSQALLGNGSSEILMLCSTSGAKAEYV